MRFLALLLAICFGGAVRAESFSEYEMKGAYVYNFAKFTEWPDFDRANFNICTLGEEDIGIAMRKLEGRTIHGRRLVIARLSSTTAIRNCQVLFIGQREVGNLRQINRLLGDYPVLTVTDVQATPSVCMTLSLDGERLVFDVNLQHCQQAKLNPGSQLLRLARSVSKAP